MQKSDVKHGMIIAYNTLVLRGGCQYVTNGTGKRVWLCTLDRKGLSSVTSGISLLFSIKYLVKKS